MFENRYKQYMEDMSTSALLLKELGLLVAEPSQPQQKAIVLATAGKIVANATADAPGAVAESPMVTATARFRGRTVSALTVAKTALIELSKVTSFKQLMERASSTQTPATCTKAWDHAFSLYKSGHGTCVCVFVCVCGVRCICGVCAVYIRCLPMGLRVCVCYVSVCFMRVLSVCVCFTKECVIGEVCLRVFVHIFDEFRRRRPYALFARPNRCPRTRAPTHPTPHSSQMRTLSTTDTLRRSAWRSTST